MSNTYEGYLATRIAQLYANEGNLDANMASYDKYPLLKFAYDQAPFIISEDLKNKAWRSQGTLVKYPVMARESITTGSSRSCTISDDDAATALLGVTWTTITADLVFSNADWHNNAYDSNLA